MFGALPINVKREEGEVHKERACDLEEFGAVFVVDYKAINVFQRILDGIVQTINSDRGLLREKC